VNDTTHIDHTGRVRVAMSAILAAKGVSEMDGPPRASFVGDDGQTYKYDAFSLGAKNDVALLEAGMAQAIHLVPDGMKVVWRMRPEIQFQGISLATTIEAPHWAGYWRYIAIPKSVAPVFEEGDRT
jgi:hypothetical protein